MRNKLMFWLRIYGLTAFLLFAAIANAKGIQLKSTRLEDAVAEYVSQISEFRELQRISKGHSEITLWIGGGGAARIALAVNRYLEESAKLGKAKPLPDHIVDLFSEGQDLDIYYRGMDQEVADELEGAIAERYDYRNGEGNPKWEFNPVPDFSDPRSEWARQNIDLMSMGLVQLTRNNSTRSQKILTSLTGLADGNDEFINAVKGQRNIYYDRSTHASTKRALNGKNPKVVSAMKFVVNCLRFSLQCNFKKVQEIFANFDTESALRQETTGYFAGRFSRVLTASLMDVPDLKAAIKTYKELGILRIFHQIHSKDFHSTQFWRLFEIAKNSKLQSLGPTSYSSRESILDLREIPHLSIIDGSQHFGGELPSMLVDLNSFDGQMARFLREALNEVKADYQIRLQAGFVLLGDIMDRDSDIIAYLDAYEDERELDCRAYAYISKVVGELLGIKVHIISYERHTEAQWEFKPGMTHEVSREGNEKSSHFAAYQNELSPLAAVKKRLEYTVYTRRLQTPVAPKPADIALKEYAEQGPNGQQAASRKKLIKLLALVRSLKAEKTAAKISRFLDPIMDEKEKADAWLRQRSELVHHMMATGDYSRIQQISNADLMELLSSDDRHVRTFAVYFLVQRNLTSNINGSHLLDVVKELDNSNVEKSGEGVLDPTMMAARILVRLRSNNQVIQSELLASLKAEDDIEIALMAGLAYLRNGGSYADVEHEIDNLRTAIENQSQHPENSNTLQTLLSKILVFSENQGGQSCRAFTGS